MPTNQELFDRLDAALQEVVDKWRPQILAGHGKVTSTIKADKSPVSELDLSIEPDLKAAVMRVDPTLGFVGEEFGSEGDTERFVMCDPIDGSEQEERGMPGVRVMATLAEGKELKYTFVHDVLTNDTYTARSGEGAFCNGKPIKLSSRPPDRAWIELTCNQHLPISGELMNLLRNNCRGVRVTGDFTHTPQGRLEGHMYYQGAGSIWDWSPWALLIKEAGGKVANFGSDEFDFTNNCFLAAPVHIFDFLKPLIDDALREGGHL